MHSFNLSHSPKRAYGKLSLNLVYKPLTDRPKMPTAKAIATAMQPTRMAYSTDDAPDSSLKNLLIIFSTHAPPVGFDQDK